MWRWVQPQPRDLPKLGKLLIEGREAAGLSLREVQRRTGIHNAHLSQIEKGRIERPEVGLLFQLGELYGIELGTLLESAGHLSGLHGAPQRAMATAALRAVDQLPAPRQAEALSYLNRLAQPPRATDAGLSESAQARAASVAERALEWAGVSEAPTRLDQIAAVAGVERIRDTNAIPDEIEVKKPRLWKRILGAVLFSEKTIYVDRQNQIAPRANFTEAHEIAHVLLPWHQDAFRIDDERRLFYDTHEELESEANYVAAHLIFQGHRYHERALEDRVSIATPIELAGVYRASLHASIRYYVEHHPDSVAVVVAGRYTQYDGTLPIWTSFESASFLRRFGSFVGQLPGFGLPIDPALPLGKIAASVRESPRSSAR